MGENLGNKIWNIFNKNLSSLKLSLYMKKLPTYLTEQNNAVENQLQ